MVVVRGGKGEVPISLKALAPGYAGDTLQYCLVSVKHRFFGEQFDDYDKLVCHAYLHRRLSFNGHRRGHVEKSDLIASKYLSSVQLCNVVCVLNCLPVT
jgi:hypothetical protein